ncbi:hypothetical protein CRYUN_Cryun16bG0140900 [Craigia yunnanensis]
MSSLLNTVSSLRLSRIHTSNNNNHTHLRFPTHSVLSPASVSFTRRILTVRAADTDTNEVKSKAPDKAPAGGGSGSSSNQLLRIKGTAQETNKWKIRLQLTKPVTWPPLVWGVVCGAASGNFHWNLEDVDKSILCMIMSGPCLTGYTQTLNDWYDREIDAINEPYRPIPSGAISENVVISQIWLLLLGGLGIAALLDVWAGHDFPIVFYLALGGSLLSYINSAPPLKLKQNGWIGNFALGASYISLPWWAGQALFGTLTPDNCSHTLVQHSWGIVFSSMSHPCLCLRAAAETYGQRLLVLYLDSSMSIPSSAARSPPDLSVVLSPPLRPISWYPSVPICSVLVWPPLLPSFCKVFLSFETLATSSTGNNSLSLPCPGVKFLSFLLRCHDNFHSSRGCFASFFNTAWKLTQA